MGSNEMVAEGQFPDNFCTFSILSLSSIVKMYFSFFCLKIKPYNYNHGKHKYRNAFFTTKLWMV